MVLHLVLFRFKPEEKVHLDEAVASLKSMVGRVEGIRDLKAGKDFVHSGRSYDLAVAVTLDDAEALKVYDTHPQHLPVKKFLAPFLDGSVSVDFEY